MYNYSKCCEQIAWLKVRGESYTLLIMQAILFERVLDIWVETHELDIIDHFVDVMGLEHVLRELLSSEVLHGLKIPGEVLDWFGEELCSHAALVI